MEWRPLQRRCARPTARPPKKLLVRYRSFMYRAPSWDRERRVVAKVEWHQGELFARVGFIVTNCPGGASGSFGSINQRGTAEQWIKEGKYAVKWTRLSCRNFRARQPAVHR